MTRCIVTHASGPHEELLPISEPGFRDFAQRHGYDFVVGEKLTDRPPAWNKVYLILEMLAKYSDVLWLDADLVIVDPSQDLPVKPSATMAMVRHFSAMSEV